MDRLTAEEQKGRSSTRTVAARVARLLALPGAVLVLGLAYTSWVDQQRASEGQCARERVQKAIDARWRDGTTLDLLFASSEPILVSALRDRVSTLAASIGVAPTVVVDVGDDGPATDGAASHTVRLMVEGRALLGLRVRMGDDCAITLIGVFTPTS